MMEDDFDDQWYDGGDGRDDIVDDEHNLGDGFSFLSLAEEAAIAAWDAVEAEWNEVARSYAPAGHTFVALRAVLFRIQHVVLVVVFMLVSQQVNNLSSIINTSNPIFRK